MVTTASSDCVLSDSISCHSLFVYTMPQNAFVRFLSLTLGPRSNRKNSSGVKLFRIFQIECICIYTQRIQTTIFAYPIPIYIFVTFSITVIEYISDVDIFVSIRAMHISCGIVRMLVCVCLAPGTVMSTIQNCMRFFVEFMQFWYFLCLPSTFTAGCAHTRTVLICTMHMSNWCFYCSSMLARLMLLKWSIYIFIYIYKSKIKMKNGEEMQTIAQKLWEIRRKLKRKWSDSRTNLWCNPFHYT